MAKENRLVILIDKKKKRAIAFEGKDIDTELYGQDGRHVKYRWKLDNIDITKDGADFNFQKDDIEERRKLVKEIVKKLKSKVDIGKFLLDKFDDESIETIKDIHTRLTKDATVKNKDGCFYLSIGGRRGKPAKLFLRE
jgi:hypothetical protein